MKCAIILKNMNNFILSVKVITIFTFLPLKKKKITNVMTPMLLNTIKELEQISDLWFPTIKAIVTLHYGITFLHASAKSIPNYTNEFVRPVKKSDVPVDHFSSSSQKLL